MCKITYIQLVLSVVFKAITSVSLPLSVPHPTPTTRMIARTKTISENGGFSETFVWFQSFRYSLLSLSESVSRLADLDTEFLLSHIFLRSTTSFLPCTECTFGENISRSKLLERDELERERGPQIGFRKTFFLFCWTKEESWLRRMIPRAVLCHWAD